ncbi:anti-sigma factor [Qingshengfaniella alkalisoli]|uniref:Anti-sigma K factor RskA C-terminal domain-containing protein n=1 Tax=Qingshengfaniella alkalisoli TaxID=2599296 RepID=A0A5B8J035_9RHOB|nr:anti-sigma factor [Qingshengfaniella alkalisoli]QDY70551.1 hypothetical protein FPZ52_12680 [Qingshengfaniella alkalisoli]
MSDQQDISEDEALVAEYVLRLLDADAERALEARLQSEPDLRARVQFWEGEFANLAVDLPDETPSSSVRSGLLAELNGKVTAPRFGWVRGWLALPGLVAVVIAAFFAFSPILRAPAFDPAFHATLISDDGSVHIEAGYAPNGSLFKVIPEQGKPLPGRDFELWVIGENATAPVSLGVISSDGEITFEISPEIAALIEGGTLAVSDEPEGGSPTGAPTGTILATDEFFDV